MLKEIIKKCNKTNASAVGADATFCPIFREHTKNTPAANSNPNSKIQILTSDHKAITLVALIITIIVMLILVGVTVNVALDGGLFEKAKKATYLTEISEIQEQLEVEKAIKIAENSGKIPKNYGFKLEDLDISNSLKEKYKDKLTVSNGVLYYKEDKVTNKTEQNWLEEMGVTAFKEPVNEHHEIHVGDEWTNVTFDKLPETEPENLENVIVAVQDESRNILWLLVYFSEENAVGMPQCVYVLGFRCGGDVIMDDSPCMGYIYVWKPDEGASVSEAGWSDMINESPVQGDTGISGHVVQVCIGNEDNTDEEFSTLVEYEQEQDFLGNVSDNSSLYIDGGFADWISGEIEYVK